METRLTKETEPGDTLEVSRFQNEDNMHDIQDLLRKMPGGGATWEVKDGGFITLQCTFETHWQARAARAYMNELISQGITVRS